MSDALRELVVSIDFNEVDVSKLTRIDREMDDIERSMREVGADIRRMGSQLDRAGTEGARAMDEIGRHTDRAGDAMDELARDGRRAGDRVGNAANDAGQELREMGNDGDKAMDEITRSAKKAEAAVEDVGEAAGKSGEKGKAGTGKILDVLGEVVPAGRTAGLASAAFANPWVAAGVAVVAAIGGVSIALVKLANDTDAAMDRIEALTGTTGAELEGLKTTAKNVFQAGFGEDLRTVGDDVATLRGQFKNLDNGELEKLAKGAYIIQDAFGPEVKETGGIIKSMTANFKELGETEALDLITYAFQNGGNYADDLMDTLKEYSVYFSKMGMDAKDFVGTLLKGGDAGAWNLDKVADSVKEFGIRAIDGSEGTADAFKALGFDADDMAGKLAAGGDSAHKAFMATVAALSFVDDEVKRGQMGVALFGTQWEDVREDVIFAMDGARDAVKDFEGSTQKAGDALQDNFGSKWEKVKRGLTLGLADMFGDTEGGIGSGFLDGIIANLPAIQEGLKAFGAWFGEFFGAGGMGAYLDGFASLWKGVWDIVVGVWNIVGPFLTETIGGAFNVIWNIAGTTLGAIGDAFSIFGKLLQGDWAGAWQSVKDLFNGVMDGFIGVGKATLEMLFGIFDSTIGRVIELIWGVDLTEAGQNIIDGLINGVKNMKNAAVDAVKDVAKGIWGGVKDFFDIRSPSRLMAETGAFVVEGMEVGISDSAIGAVDAARDMAAGIADAAMPPKLPVLGPIMAPATQNPPTVPQMAGGPQIAPEAPAYAPAQGTNGNVSVSIPVTVNVPAGTSVEQAEDIGEMVAKAVNEKVAALFVQLGIKFAT